MGHRIAPELLAALGSPELESEALERVGRARVRALALRAARGGGGCMGCGAPVARSGALPVPVIDGGALAPVEQARRSGAGDGLASDGRGAVDGGD
jgi:hypothetical protein